MRDINWSTPLSYEKQEVLAPGSPNPPIEVEVGKAEVAEVELVRWNKGVERDVESLRARSFVKLVEEGATPTAAADALQTDIKTIRRTRSQVEASVQAVLDSHGWMPPIVKKQYIRARQLQVMDIALAAVEADPTDSKMLKILLDATKVIGDDKEINIYDTKTVIAPIQHPALPPGLAALVSGVEVNPEHVKESIDDEATN